MRWALALGLFVWMFFVATPVFGDTVSGGALSSDAAVVPESSAESTEPAGMNDAGTGESAETEPAEVDDFAAELAQATDVVDYYKKVGFLRFIWNFFTHIREFLEHFIGGMGVWAYVTLWAILFCETGLVVMAFLPGDSLLFATGTLSNWGVVEGYPLDLYFLLPILITGPILGDSCNYWIGRLFGQRIVNKEKNRFFKKSHIEKAHAFYARHGGKAVAIGRFIPLIRTFVPFVAGVGRMDYRRFLAFSVIGSILWINICVLAGWVFGRNEFVKNHFETIVIAIVLISLMPAIITFLRSRKATKAQTVAAAKTDDAETQGREDTETK